MNTLIKQSRTVSNSSVTFPTLPQIVAWTDGYMAYRKIRTAMIRVAWPLENFFGFLGSAHLFRIFGECPPHLTQMLVRNVDVNGRSSRHGHLNLICPRFKRETEGGRSFSVSTSRLWNMLPTHIKNQSTLTSFKKSIFKHFMDSYKELDHFII